MTNIHAGQEEDLQDSRRAKGLEKNRRRPLFFAGPGGIKKAAAGPGKTGEERA